MKTYQLKRTQFLPITLEQAWEFFSSPENLSKITPAYMNFKITYNSGSHTKMYAGQIIKYKIHILPGIPVRWVTEITDVNKPNSFIDEQRSGPYSLWRHQHVFIEVPGGVQMTDIVDYAIPLGIIGRLANSVFVARQLNGIFDYRSTELNNIFPKATKATKIVS